MLQSIASRIRHWLHADFDDRAEQQVAAAAEKTARKVASRFSRGNVRIQRGAFVTTNALEERRKNARKFKFAT